ncbi:MAG: hypothetical protein O3C05_01795, partial [Proteobacteria bacterium]|nr:hypothetical protein [Pseudomonadota bacterium]
MDFDIYRKCFRITLCALLMLIINAQKNAIYAGGLSYNDCVFSWEFGEVNRTPIIVRPVGKICYDRCQAECLAFARAKNGEDITDPDSYAANNEIQDDLNKDIIEQCIVLCQKGEIFKSKFREYDSSIKDKIQFRWSDKIAEIKAACNPASGSVGSAEYHYYSANLKIKVGDKIRITLINPTSSMENAVYLCGFKTVRMDTEDHRGSLDADLWGNHSWWKPYMNQSAYNDFVSYGVNHPRRWSARNKYENYTDIGIKIYDGDSLSIQYRGNFISNINSAGGLDNSLSMIMLKDFLGISIPKVYALPGSGFNNSDINFSSDKPNDYPSDVNPSYGQAQKVFLGLQGKVTYSSRDFNGYIFEGIKRQVADPNDQSKERYPMYNFWGVIEGLNKEFANPTSLFMSHGSASSNRDSAVGGFDTRITWRGCRYTHEDEVLEYAIVPKSKVGDETIYNPAQDPNIWEKVDITNLKEGKEFEPKMQGNEGILYLRINKVADHGGGDGREVERYNTSGGIFVFAEKSEKKNPVSGIISNVVKKVDDLLYKFEGYDSSNGVIKKVYKRFIEDGG